MDNVYITCTASVMLIVLVVALLCDWYSLDWLRYFDDLASNVTVYI